MDSIFTMIDALNSNDLFNILNIDEIGIIAKNKSMKTFVELPKTLV